MLLEDFELIDLTHVMHPGIPTWTGSCGYCLDVKMDYDETFKVQQMKMHAGIGTHMDAPSHRFEGAASIESIALENLICKAACIDVSHKATADYTISLQDILDYEKDHGPIIKNNLVIGYTGWDKYWNTPDLYRNVDGNGKMHFPSFSEEAALYLLEKDIAGLAIDTLSPDSPLSTFPVHKAILGAGKYIIENIANAAQMPPKGGYVIVLPINAQGATEAPIRIIGLKPLPQRAKE